MNWRELWESLKTGIVNTAVRAGAIFGAMALWGSLHPAVAVLGLGATLAVGAYRWIKDEQRHHRDLLDQFRPQIAAETGKSIDLVTTKDLQQVAEHHPIIRQSINEKKARIATSGTALALAGFTTLMVGALIPFDFLATATSGPQTFFNWVMNVGISPLGENVGFKIGGTLIAGAAMGVARTVFGWVSKAIYGGDRTTVAERIEALEVQLGKGIALQPEQVFSVAIATNPELAHNIKKAWGRDYDQMQPMEQCVALQHYPAKEQVARLTEAVNRGNVYPAEIAYAVLGKSSGVPWDPFPTGPKVRPKALDLGELAEELPEIFTEGPSLENLGGVAKTIRNNMRPRYQPAAGYQPPQPRKSFVAALDAEREAAMGTQRGV